MRLIIQSILTLAACLLASNAMAGGPVDKITGDFTHGNCPEMACEPGDPLNYVSHKLISGHEARGKHPQKGFVFSWNDEGRWFEMDLWDTHNNCVHIFEDGRVRTGGLVSDGNGPQVGRYFGLELLDGGEPAFYVDYGTTVRFSLDYYSEAARLAFLEWCETGDFPREGLVGVAFWPHVIFEGNLQVHNSDRDGD
ncbi:MAG: hypothetical protein HKP02_14060 [Xanthomonadales bacterium]|nr:hypothetical protein [Xanthomonadales bacterium]